ncbi:hypothetical protein L9F63_010164 [Diploptera punctata]|uniref:DNA/RNA non-specific endonuclease/pyrophosphatase/phosphodiesterase domain-containing protein n=1 Tax=Diploptera punctata TaxID=6984 RepID=A0AAD8AHM8_DIPPU|nr:hypothetical protein L9F63_010164 [Diploptera punctata]
MSFLDTKFKLLVCFLYILGILLQPSESVCSIDLRSAIMGKSPLLLHSGDNVLPDGTAFLLPRMNSVIATLHAGEEVEFLCAGASNKFNLSGDVRDVNYIQGYCVSGSNFNLGQHSYSLDKISCKEEVKSSVKDVGSCTGGSKRLQIGFSKPNNEFIKLIDICLKGSSLIPSYLNYTLVEGIDNRQMLEEVDNPDKTDYFNNLPNSMQYYYTCSNQQTIVGSILGSKAVASQKIVCSDSSNYFVKVHLAPSSDFVYQQQQRSARYLINTIPMWESIANGNWQKLENEIRLYASNISRESSDLIIYAGTLDVTTLPDNNRVQKSIYLENNKLPVPQWVWKVVYEPQAREGIVFILVNNPYHLKFARCRCVCAQTKWTLGWNRQEKNKGYIYCCTVENFRNVYSALPQFEVTGLLKKDRPYNPIPVEIEPQK